MCLEPPMNAAVSVRFADAARERNARRSPFGIGEFQDPAGSPGDFGDGLVAEVVDQLIQGRRHRRQRGEFLDQRIPRGQRLLAQHRVAVIVQRRAGSSGSPPRP